MRNEDLIQSVRDPETLGNKQLQELLELSRKYPFFATPLVVLSKYMKQANTPGYEDLLYKTALRVPDREWLHAVLHSGDPFGMQSQSATSVISAEPDFGQIPGELHTEYNETEEPETSALVSDDIRDTDDSVSLDPELNPIDISTEWPEPREEVTENPAPDPIENERNAVEVPETWESENEDTAADVDPDKETSEKESSTPAEIPEEVDEITNSEESDTYEATEEDDLEEEVPVSIPETEITEEAIESEPETPESTGNQYSTEENEEIFEEIADFSVNLGTGVTPEIKETVEESAAIEAEIFEDEIPVLNALEEQSIMASLEEIEGLLMSGAGVNLQPDVDHRPRPRLMSQATIYDIENYFPAVVDTNAQPTDFYSWLSNPKFSTKPGDPAEGKEEKKQRHGALVKKFIETNPSISRPQKDFFNPVDAAKKSEHMPVELATETLAKVYLAQENFAGALKIYEQLLLKMPEKKTYFAGQIKKIKKEYEL